MTRNRARHDKSCKGCNLVFVPECQVHADEREARKIRAEMAKDRLRLANSRRALATAVAEFTALVASLDEILGHEVDDVGRRKNQDMHARWRYLLDNAVREQRKASKVLSDQTD